jgi:hypothetical protein
MNGVKRKLYENSRVGILHQLSLPYLKMIAATLEDEVQRSRDQWPHS